MLITILSLAFATEPTAQSSINDAHEAVKLLQVAAVIYPESLWQTLLCPTVGVAGKIIGGANSDHTYNIFVSLAVPNDQGTFDTPVILKDTNADGTLDYPADAKSQVLYSDSLRCYLLTH